MRRADAQTFPKRQLPALVLVFALVATGFGWLIWDRLTGLRMAAALDRYATATGRVVSSTVRMGGDANVFTPVVRHEYEVGGRRFVSERVTCFEHWFQSETRAAAESAKYPAGAIIEVRYDASDPAKAVLSPAIDSSDHQTAVLFVSVFGGLLALGGLGVAVTLCRAMRR